MKSLLETQGIALQGYDETATDGYTVEQRLVMAVIQRAILDYQGTYWLATNPHGTSTERSVLKSEAAYWLTSPKHREWSFLWCLAWICDDPEGMQKKVLDELDHGEMKKRADEWHQLMEIKRARKLLTNRSLSRQLELLKQ